VWVRLGGWGLGVWVRVLDDLVVSTVVSIVSVSKNLLKPFHLTVLLYAIIFHRSRCF